MYAKLENNKLIYVPKDYNTGDYLIINFNKNEELMKQYGFKEVIDIKPEYDNNTQYLSVKDYTEKEDSIIINYKINEIEYQKQQPTLEEQISDINSVLDITLLATDEILTLIEPLLPEHLVQDIQSRTIDRLINMYSVMVKREIKDLDEVPIKYREQVREIIEKEE